MSGPPAAGRLPLTRFPPDASAIPDARHRLLEFLAEHDLSEAVQTLAALLVSELATNVVLHAHTPFALCAELTACELRVEVADGSSQPPVVMNPAPEEPGSRGMLIISSLADDWGVDPTPDGKLVWFGLSLVGR